MLRIWIFFNKQTIYLEETTAQRKNQIAERAGANLGRSHSWKYRHPQQSTYPWEVFSADLFAIFKAIYWGNCTWFNLSRLTAPFIWFRELELDYGYLMNYCLPGLLVIVTKYFYNILDDVRREQIPPQRFSEVIYVKVKAIPRINFKRLVYQSAY